MNLPVPADQCVKRLETQLHANLHDGELLYTDQNKKFLIEHEDLIFLYCIAGREHLSHLYLSV
jgi:hypothetical protein